MSSHSKLIILIFLTLIFTGCLSLGPDYKSPELDIKEKRFKNSFVSDLKQVSYDRWWYVFNDEVLNKLIDKVLIKNFDIKIQNSTITELLSWFRNSRADQFPSLNASMEIKRTRIKNIYDKKTTSDSYSLALPLSYELDIWGKIRRTKEAAFADLMQAKYNRTAVIQSIIAQTINLYLNLEYIERQISIKKRSIKAYEESLKNIKRKFNKGLSTILDLSQTKRLLSRTKAEMPQLLQELHLVQHKISLITGEFPERKSERVQPEDYYKKLETVPVGLPSELLIRRPDILAAEANLKSLNAKIGIAKANRFPSISLTATFGYSSDSLSTVFDSLNSYTNLSSGLTAPIFNAGKLKSLHKIAKENYRQGLYSYYKKVMTAFKEVDDTLVVREKQIKKRDLVISYLKECRLTQSIAEKRYEKGLVNYQTVLDSMHNTFTAEELLIGVDYIIYTNRVQLHKSLGGGWYSQKDGNSSKK